MAAAYHYQNFLRARIEGAVAEAKAAAMVSHQGVKGTVLEILVSRLFRPLLPADIGIGTGQIIDLEGRMSNQVDIVLYDRAILPPAMYDESTGLFPVEAVLYAIEVKTTLVKAELERAHRAALLLASFHYVSGQFDENGQAIEHQIERVRSVVFALSSSGASAGEAARYHAIYAPKDENPAIRAICVAGKEYVYDDGRKWVTQKFVKPYDEILSFLGGVTNTYRQVARSRGSPLLGHYVIPEAPVTYGPITDTTGRITFKCQTVDCPNTVDDWPHIPLQGPVTVNGTINLDYTCPLCGGELRSDTGTYNFKGGKLVARSAISI